MSKFVFRHYTPVLTALLLLFSMCVTANAQEFRGAITGTVNDPQGAVIPGATVIVRNIATNVSSTVNTNEEGAYTFPSLLPGTYSVSAASENFQTTVRENIVLNVDDRLTVDFQLQIGTTTEVNIVAATELIEQGSVTTGTIISNRQIEELPLPEGAAYNLATQAPGISYTGNPQFTGPTANGNLAAFRSNGAGGNQITLDGSPNLSFAGQVAFTPPADAVQQFKVQTNSFDAQNGFTAGATVNVAVKSGTNDLHGSVYYFDRDRSRTANNFFSNRQGEERPERKYYRYGGVLNGPVRLPYLYDGRDRTFFMFAYEKQRNQLAEPELFNVPPAAMRNGDFSELIVNRNNIADPANVIIYNPFAARQSGSNVVRQSFGCDVPANTPVPANCNIIPANLINPAAQAFLNLYPLPNRTGNLLADNFFSNQVSSQPYNSFLTRLDHNFNSSNQIFAKYYFSRSREDRYNFIGTPDAITRGLETRTNNGGNINYTSTLNSNFVLDLRSSYNEFVQERRATNPVSAADLGFTGLAALTSSTIFPRFDFRNFDTLGAERADFNEGLIRPFSLFSVQPTLTQIYGDHTFKYGYDYRKLRERFDSNGYNAGRFFFDGTYTAPASNSNATARNLAGRDVAAFLLGVPSAGTNSLIENAAGYRASSSYHGFFIQDDWRVSPRLTLNLGLRYEVEPGVTESAGRIVTGFDTTTVSPLQAAAQANYASFATAPIPGITADQFALRGGLLFAANGNTASQGTDKNNFQPRIGISYSLNDKTVVRGGFGIFTAPFQIQAINQTGFIASTPFTTSLNNGLTIAGTLSNPFPDGLNTATGSSLGLATFVGRDLITTNATGPTTSILPYERQNASYARFIVGIQRELPFRIGVEATYVRSNGYNLPVFRQLNYIPRQYLNEGQAYSQSTQDFLSAIVSNPLRGLIPGNQTYNASTIQRRLLLVPYPQFGNIAVTEYNGSSTFNSLQFQVTKRLTQGLSFNSSYTFSREREQTRYLNPQDEELIEQISPFERPHRFTLSTVFELPVGRGRAFGENLNPVVDALIGGWQLTAVYERQSGEPLTFGNVYYEGDPTQLVSRLGERDEQGRRYGIDVPAFDITGFYPGGVVNRTSPVIGLGNNYTFSSTNTLRYFPLTTDNLRNQPFTKFDVGLGKNFRFNENLRLQVRAEAINVLNYPYFSGLTLDPANANFGFANAQRNLPRDIQLGARFVF